MAKPRQKESGKWEIGLRHPSLPGGRKYFTFDTEVEAITYAAQWKMMKMANIAPPDELLQASRQQTVILAQIVRAWINSGLAAQTQHSALRSLVKEVGSVRLVDANYKWLMGYIQRLKIENNLAPTSIRHRIQALGRSIDEYLRHHETLVFQSPVKLLPKGYATYSEVDAKLAGAKGKAARFDVSRDRRLHAGEEEKIVAALSGWERPDRERGLLLKGGDALLALFLLIVNTGLRLKEAFTLTRGQIDMDGKVIRAQSSKQWRGKVAYREIPMRPETHRALAIYLAKRPMLPNAYLFPFMTEEPGITLKKAGNRLSSRLSIAFKYVGIADLREHDLRHEATCRWLEMKSSRGNWLFRLEEVNKIMGWSSNSPMASRYASFRGADMVARMWSEEPAGSAAVALK